MTNAMPSIPQETLQRLLQTLTDLASDDNDTRISAETVLNSEWMVKQPDALLLGLAHFTRNSEVTDLRSFAAVLMRRVAFKSAPEQQQQQGSKKTSTTEVTLWDVTQEATRTTTKALFLESLSRENHRSVRNKICDTIAEMARASSTGTKEQSWPELLPALFECANSTRSELRESAYRVFASMPSLIVTQPADTLHNMFAESFKDADLHVRLAATKAVVACMLDADHDSRYTLFPLMPSMLDTLRALLASKDETGLVEGLVAMIELAEHSPRLFKQVLLLIHPFMLSIIKDKTLEDRTRQSALELLLTLAECTSNLIRKVPDFATTLVPIALEMMTELDDEEDETWYTSDDLDEEDPEANSETGERAMDRLARALGGKAILPISFVYIPQMLASKEWKARHAGLMAVSAIGEGCVKAMEGELAKIIQMVLPFLKDPHPRVRYAACNAIGQMATDFAGVIQKKYHAIILTNLIPVMDDAPYPRVRAHAAAALVNFCEAAEKRILEPYLDAIFERLLSLLNTGTTYVQEQAITTIATVADSAEERFVKYYSGIMPLLMNVLRQAMGQEYRLMRGKAMECASLIALAVGKEVFAPHAQEFVKLLVQTQTTATESDDPQVAYLLAAWARVCKVLGKDFVPYLDIVMPPLLASAQLKPDVAVLDPEDDVESKYSTEDGWEFVGVDGRQIGIKTTVLEEKCTAVELLICYARELGSGFRPYIEKVRDIVLPLLRFYFHDGVRHAAAATLPQLVSCAKKSELGQEYLISFWHGIAIKILEVMSKETDLAFLHQLYATFYEAVDIMGPGPNLSPELLELFTRATEVQLKEMFVRLKRREEEARASGGEEEKSEGEEEITEETVLNEISRAFHSVLKTHRVGYMVQFKSLERVIGIYLEDPNPTARQWAICVLDDFVEFTGPHSWPIMVPFLPMILESILNTAPDVRQAACYGLGLCGQFGGPQYAEVCSVALTPLFQVIHEPGSRNIENVFATENAISAVTKICQFNRSQFDVNTVLPSWLQTLPIVNDEVEAPFTYTYLLDLIEAQHPSVLGLNNVNMPHLVTVLVEALAAAVVSEPLTTRMVCTLKAILSTLDGTMVATIWNSIAPEKRKTLQDLKYI
ncbi:importin subunit beta-3 [Gamsiella multidivaricata]|uniref:importin subunit beta-3 n=1 Tax=Gamsiella multidivaricata TaxID=101098 RepID=UPI00221FC46A|nr:importin subunit beta-3 [Gamsiella multidivaricata]KAG0362852.1 hypothetical protein BGZ54_008461 [Gamsiella multidivaricata]KAI7817403.1 importin subunit beta-3 [Gamsiella multidivaricata]